MMCHPPRMLETFGTPLEGVNPNVAVPLNVIIGRGGTMCLDQILDLVIHSTRLVSLTVVGYPRLVRGGRVMRRLLNHYILHHIYLKGSRPLGHSRRVEAAIMEVQVCLPSHPSSSQCPTRTQNSSVSHLLPFRTGVTLRVRHRSAPHRAITCCMSHGNLASMTTARFHGNIIHHPIGIGYHRPIRV